MQLPPLLIVLTHLSASVASAAAPHATWFPSAPKLPAPTGKVIRVSSVDELLKATKNAGPGENDLARRRPLFLATLL